MMNAVGGTSLHYWAQSWRLNPVGLQGRQRDDAALRRVADSEGLDGRGLAVRLRRARAVLRQGRVRDRRVGQGGQRQGHDRSARQHLRGRARARLSDAAAARHRVHRDDGDGRAQARLASVPRPGRDQLAQPTRTARAARITATAARGGCHVNAKGSTAVTTIPKAQATKRLTVVTEAHVTTIEVDADGRASGVNYLKGGDRVLPAGVGRAARELHLRERRACCCCRSRRRFRTGCRTTTARSGGTTSATTRSARVHRAVPAATSNNWYGLPAQGVAVDDWADDNFDHAGSTSSAAAISGSTPTGARSPPPSMTTFGSAPRWGSAWKAFVKQNADRRTRRICRRRRCRTRTTISISIRR